MKKGSRHFVDQLAFRASFREGKVPGVRSAQLADVVKGDDGKFAFVMSTADTDRMGDTIQQDGWDLSAFMKNPVFLWAHNYGMPPPGKVGRALVEEGRLVARDVEFQAREVYEFGWSVGQMYAQKFLNAVSVGFQPTVLEWKDDDSGGIDFQKQELLELSAVPVPANANALQLAKSAGLFVPAWKGWSEQVLDEAAGVDERALNEDGRRVLHFARSVREVIAPPAVAVPRGVEPAPGDEPVPEFVELIAALRENTAAVREHSELMRKAAGDAARKSIVDEIKRKTLSLL